jgi:predicted RNA-binding Zn-ribbon protein involved in translation (DUF1610 family)
MAQILGAGGQPIGGQNDEVEIPLEKTTSIACNKCGGEVFVQGFGFRKISKLLTGKPKDEVLPVELFLCGECGEVLNEVLPPGLKIEQE